MNDYKMIHETPIRDLIDLIGFVKDVKNKNVSLNDMVNTEARAKGFKTSTSISRLASNMTLVFPVMCSTTLGIDTDIMIMKAIERKCVAMLQILFSAYQFTSFDNAQDFLNQFHSNIRIGNRPTVDDFINVASAFTAKGKSSVDEAALAQLSKDFRENCFFVLEDDIAPQSIAEMYESASSSKNSYKTLYNDTPDTEGAYRTYNKNGNKQLYKDTPNTKGDTSYDNSSRKKNGAENKDTPARTMKDMSEWFSKQVVDSDIKKANELTPTLMTINLKYLDPDTGRSVPMDNVMIGIKCRLIPVTSDDIINHILTKLNDKNYVVQLVRATTREISFLKDFLLAVDQAKIEALANSRRGSTNPMWKVLERRSKKSRIKRMSGLSGNNANAITSLVISQEEVDYVRKNFNKDFDSIATVNTILDSYNLLSFVIADEALETVKFLFDGEGGFETLSFSALEREAGDNSYKKIVNLMSKIS